MKVGLVLPQSAADGGGGTWSEIASLARQAEDGGIDSLWLADHFFWRPEDGQEIGIHEAWTLLSGLAATTTRVELGSLVLATSFRPPGLVAKMAATLDDISGGRLILGLGCGWYEDEYEAFGYPFDHRVGRFEEAVSIIRPLLRGERVTFEGQWSVVRDAAAEPLRRPVPIMIAAKGERMLRLTARFADAWQTAWFGVPDERFNDRLAGLRAACESEGRDPATLELTVGISVGEDPGSNARRPQSLVLDASAIADGLATWAAEGVGHLQLGLPTSTSETFEVCLDGLRRYRESEGRG